MARYAVTYSETITCTVVIIAASPEEAKQIVQSGDCDEGRCIDAQFQGVSEVKEI